MGTRGLRIIVHNGRYFVYYNNFDSYPKGLGRDLVDGIPTNRDEYKAWLERERKKYAELTTQLENKCLTVFKDTITEIVAKKPINSVTSWRGEGVPNTWKEVDDGLNELPSALCNVGLDLYIEWLYILDLDNERFSVDNWIFFNLYDIPCDRWINALTYDAEGKSFSFDICPEALAIVQPPGYFSGKAESDYNRCRDIYQQYSVLAVRAMSDIDISCRAALEQILGVILFDRSTFYQDTHFWEYLPLWSHENFAFREVAFAILSFATGQYYFDNRSRFYGAHYQSETNGYIIDPNEGGEPQLMPLFASGCHLHSREPGSAPCKSIYWFENVLVSLVPDTVFDQDTDAAIAKAVEHGFENRMNFQMVLFSVRRAMMVEVQRRDDVTVIRRADVVLISDSRANDEEDGESDNNHDSDCNNADNSSKEDNSGDGGPKTHARSPLERACHRNSGFVALQNFFNTAKNRQLTIFSRGCFPAEIYAKIITNAGYSTRKACAQVSSIFRLLCQDSFFFSSDLMITKFEVFPNSDLRVTNNMRSRSDVSRFGAFTLQDRKTGHVMSSTLNIKPVNHKNKAVWCPVIGDEFRPSMMSLFDVQLGQAI